MSSATRLNEKARFLTTTSPKIDDRKITGLLIEKYKGLCTGNLHITTYR